MKTIDFLPEHYRQRTLLRRARAWWGVCAAIFGSVIMLSSASQWCLHRAVKAQLIELEPLSQIAQQQEARFANLTREVAKKEETAALFAYLRHPWPRSRVIAAIVEEVPDGVELTSFHLMVEQKLASSEAVISRQRAPANDEAKKKLPPRVQDLADLRERCDSARTVVDVRGSTTDDAQLHSYVQQLSEHPLLANAQLVSLNAAETPGTERKSVFVLRIELSPGYGQPGGPDVARKPVPAADEAVPVLTTRPAADAASLEPAASEVKS